MPVQEVVADLAPALELVDVLECAPEAREEEASRAAAEIALRPFSLEEGPLVRAALIRLAADDHALSLVFHHLVFDGWSTQLVHDELTTLYEAFAAGDSPRLP